MQKQKEYDWKDSNLALFGSDTEKKVKKDAACTEPAWKNAGSKVGIQIWRIVKFKVTHWQKDQYGEFFNGDSYIILNTYKEADSDELLYDVHFWIGKKSTQDEYGTAAYKTVELDTFLDDKPVQHREVQGHESAKFKSYFGTITILKGGAETGFRRVMPEVYETRLLHVFKDETNKKKMQVVEVSAKKAHLNDKDVFIIDKGLDLYQYNGKHCSHDEKYKGSTEIGKIISSRGKAKKHVLDGVGFDHDALNCLSPDPVKEKGPLPEGVPQMFAVSDADGSLDMDPITEEGDMGTRDQLRTGDVMIINTGKHVWCWVGNEANIDERLNALSYACNYINTTDTPWLAVSVCQEGKEPAEFNAIWNA